MRRATPGFNNSCETVSRCWNRFLVRNVLKTLMIWMCSWNTCLSKEYLANLQMRQKWNRKQRNLRIGDIVLLKEEDLVRCHWRLAKVVGTMASEDNLVRKVRLLMSDPTLSKTGKRVKEPTYLERPIHKLVLLLTDSNDDDV